MVTCPECSASEKMLVLEADGKTWLCLTQGCGCRFEIKEKRAIAGEDVIKRGRAP